jgi:hypothetical protein
MQWQVLGKMPYKYCWPEAACECPRSLIPDHSDCSKLNPFAQLIEVQSHQENINMKVDDLKRQATGWIFSSVIAAAPLAGEAADGFALGKCVVAKASNSADVRPTYAAGSYLVDFHSGDPRYKNFSFNGAKVTLVKAPSHGKAVYSGDRLAVSQSWYQYSPTKGYEGQDRFVMDVEKDGVKVRIHYLIQVLPDWEPPLGYCEEGQWKISGPVGEPTAPDMSSVIAS